MGRHESECSGFRISPLKRSVFWFFSLVAAHRQREGVSKKGGTFVHLLGALFSAILPASRETTGFIVVS